MQHEDEILAWFTRWARENALIRAAILTGSRADPARTPDILSDYDIALYVADLKPFEESDAWLADFGAIMMRWPLTPQPTFDPNTITRLVQLKSGLRFDFQVTAKTAIPAAAYDAGYRILIDKDGLTAHLAAPSYSAHAIAPPSREEFETVTHEFWWDAGYVAKYLWRDELPAAKQMLAQIQHAYLYRIITWFIGMTHDWAVDAGLMGRWFKDYLDGDTWAAFEAIHAGADIDDNWDAFFRTLDLFREVGRPLAEELGYPYPATLDREASDYFREIRDMPPGDR